MFLILGKAELINKEHLPNDLRLKYLDTNMTLLKCNYVLAKINIINAMFSKSISAKRTFSDCFVINQITWYVCI